jgi:hypothetical protein
MNNSTGFAGSRVSGAEKNVIRQNRLGVGAAGELMFDEVTKGQEVGSGLNR